MKIIIEIPEKDFKEELDFDCFVCALGASDNIGIKTTPLIIGNYEEICRIYTFLGGEINRRYNDIIKGE